MKFITITFKILILFSVSFMSSHTFAKPPQCADSSWSIVCLKKQEDSIPENKCVQNASLYGQFNAFPFSTIGDCSQFDINKIKTYACNAGLRFVPRSQNICIKKDQDNATSSTCGDSLNCVCTNDAGTEINTNYFNYGKASYDDSSSPSFIQYSTDASMTSEYAIASGKTGSDILQDGSALQFHFGSEFYGAEYFVDICIKNSNAETLENSLKLNGKIFYGNAVFKTTNYITSSVLDTNVETTCMTSNGQRGPISQLSSGPFINGERRFSEITIPSAPLCVVRHYFKEKNTTDLRPNDYKKVTFQTFTDVTPSDPSQTTSTPIIYCKITKNGKEGKDKVYTCEQRTFKDNDAFVETLSNHKEFFDTDTYTGQCPIPCTL